MDAAVRTSARGRPVATTHAEIEAAAFALFGERGFAGTTIDAIAERVGISRRTLFRYYPSKNDIPWGQFDATLDHFRGLLRQYGEETSVHDAVHRAVVEFNRFPADARPSHWERMRLILTTPELLAHSALRYQQWRQVIAEYVGQRLGLPSEDLAPQAAGQVALGLAITAYEAWMRQPETPITDLVDDALAGLRTYLRA